MKKTYLIRSVVLTAFLIFSHIIASAFDFAVDGIYYNITSTTDLTLEVTYKSTYYNSYSGDVTIPETVTYNSTTYSVNGIGYKAFYDCTSLTSITIPDAVESIGDDAFYNCSSLPSITIPDTVTSIGMSAFRGCTGLTSIIIPDAVTSVRHGTFHYCTGLTSVTIGDAVTTIGSYAFYGCTGLTSITIPDAVTSIGNYAFRKCTQLTSLTIPVTTSYTTYNSSSSKCPFENSVITYLTITGEGDLVACAFYKFTALQNVTLSDGITSIGRLAFYGCTGLTSITIPDSVTSIGIYAFYNCTSLTDVTIPGNVTSIGYMAFYGCSGLTEIFIPDAVTSIGDYAFRNCTQLTSLTIPVSASYTTYYDSSTYCPFENTILTDLTITGKGDIMDYAFYNASALQNVTLGDGITSIGSWAFYGCTGLAEITIPGNVDSVGEYAFYGSTGLATIYSLNATPPTCASSYCFMATTYSKATLHVPSASLTKYAAATAWKEFLNIEEDVETAGISGLAADDTSFSVKGGSVIADGLADGTIMSVYSLDGRMIGRTTASGGSASMQVPSGVVIVRVGGHSSKILVR